MVCRRLIFCTKAPDDIITKFRSIHWQLTYGVEAATAFTDVLAAAIAISDQVFLMVVRVIAARYPGTR